MKARKLGRGLDILLDRSRHGTREPPADDSTVADSGEDDPRSRPGPPAEDRGGSATETADERRPGAGDVRRLELSRIRPNPQQPRASFQRRELDSLKSSVAREGILQPVLVRRQGDAYELVAGERRFRAAQELGLETVPAIEIDVDDERMLEVALIENIHREDLNPIDTARAFEALLKLKGWTQEALAQNLAIGRTTVSNTLRLLDLPPPIQSALIRGQIQMGHAKILLAVDGAAEQLELFERIAEDRLSVRELELARDSVAPSVSAAADTGAASGSSGTDRSRRGKRSTRRRRGAAGRKPANIADLEEELSAALGTRVTILEKKGKGVVRIEFYSPEDFEHVRRLLLAEAKKA